MKTGFWEFLRQSLQGEQPMHPVERQMAKRWVKERLKRLFPELRSDPAELEKAYNQLGLEVREGSGRGGGTVYQVNLPSVADTGD
jgi:hypothetical protein